MSKPEDHLVRTADLESAQIALSTLTGMARLQLQMQRLAASDELPSAAGNERFLYVLEGAATLRTTSESETESDVVLGAGDFVALAAEESATISTDRGITLLLGQSDD